MLEQVWQFFSHSYWGEQLWCWHNQQQSSPAPVWCPRAFLSRGISRAAKAPQLGERGWWGMSGIRSNGDQVPTSVKQSLESTMTRAGNQRAVLAWPESSSTCLAEGHDLSKLCPCHIKHSCSDRALLATLCCPSSCCQHSLQQRALWARHSWAEEPFWLLPELWEEDLAEQDQPVWQRDTKRHGEKASCPDTGLGLLSIVNVSGEQR